MIEGYTVLYEDDRLELVSPWVCTSYEPQPYPRFVARCNIKPKHQPPVAKCHCGFFFVKDLEHARSSQKYKPEAVLARVRVEPPAYSAGWKRDVWFRAAGFELLEVVS